jgi:hypothetical protein
MILTEENIIELVELASKYAQQKNLDVKIYVTSMLNPDTIGNADAKVVVDCLLKYHKELLKTSN